MNCPDCDLHSDCCGQPCPKHETCYHDGPGAIRRGPEGVRCLMCNERLEGPVWEHTEKDTKE